MKSRLALYLANQPENRLPVRESMLVIFAVGLALWVGVIWVLEWVI